MIVHTTGRGRMLQADPLRVAHIRTAVMLASYSHLGNRSPEYGEGRLYRDLLERHEKLGATIEQGNRPLAREILYGIGLGIDGLNTPWRVVTHHGLGLQLVGGDDLDDEVVDED